MTAILNSKCRLLLPFLAVALLAPASSAIAKTKQPSRATTTNGPAAPSLHADLNYATHDGVKLKLDLVLPKDGREPYPVVIVLHGTGFSKGRAGVRKHAEALAESGFAALAVGFRYESKDAYPAALKDVGASVDWIHANADKYNFDKKRIGILGFSGGGSLATLLSTQKPLRIRAVVSYFAPSDLTVLHQKSVGLEGWIVKGSLETWLGGTPDKAPHLYKQASPITHAHKDMAPHLLLTGTADAVVPEEQSALLYKKLKQLGVEVTLITFKDAPHNFDEETGQNAKIAFGATKQFFGEHLAQRPTADIAMAKGSR